MDETRYFTLEEANALVPSLEQAFGRIMQLRAQLRTEGEALEKLGQPTTENLLDRADGPPELRSVRARARALIETISEELERIHSLGVQVKDLDTGLCDFVAYRAGRDVLLCWRFGEKEINFWHEIDSGFAGRQPIDASFERVLH